MIRLEKKDSTKRPTDVGGSSLVFPPDNRMLWRAKETFRWPGARGADTCLGLGELGDLAVAVSGC